MKTIQKRNKLKVGIVVPHIFMHRDILPGVIFSPAKLAVDIAEGLQQRGVDVTLFSPGPVDTAVPSITADLSYFEQEIKGRGDTYTDLLKKHPFTFVTLARQVQSELIAKAYAMANAGKFDIIHIYTNEEDTALPFAALCCKPVVFTHHDPFNFLVKYKNVFPKYKELPWISMSFAQRKGMPDTTNWIGNIYHGLSNDLLRPVSNPSGDYIAYLGRVIQPKGVHVAINAVKRFNQMHPRQQLKLKIAGKHYAGHKKDTYWQDHIEPHLSDTIEYVGFLESSSAKKTFLGNAKALMVPSLFEEPFGMVIIESLACGTPVIGLDSGAIPEIINDTNTGLVVKKVLSENNTVDDIATAEALSSAISRIDAISRVACRADYEQRFTSERMCDEHVAVYQKLYDN